MKSIFCSVIFLSIAFLSNEAQAWVYHCTEQSISHHTLNNLTVSNSYGDFATLRLFLDNQPLTIPTMLPNGTNDFVSHDGDAEITIDPLTDESGTMDIWIKVKSLGIKGHLDCQAP